MRRRRRLLAPRPTSPCSGDLRARRIRLANRRTPPFRFAWQAPPGPAAPRFGLEPAHENHRRAGCQRLERAIAADCPDAVTLGLPVDRPLGPAPIAPCPA